MNEAAIGYTPFLPHILVSNIKPYILAINVNLVLRERSSALLSKNFSLSLIAEMSCTIALTKITIKECKRLSHLEI